MTPIRLSAHALALLPEDHAERAYSHLVLGCLALDQGQWEHAAVGFETCCRLAEASSDQRLACWGLTNLGVALWRLGRHEEAGERYRQAIDAFQAIGDPVHEAVARMNLALVHLSQGRPGEAQELLLQAEPVFRQAHDTIRRAMVFNNLGDAYQQQHEWAKAEENHRAAVSIWRQVGNAVGSAEALDGLGRQFAEQGRRAEAQAAYEEALRELAAAGEAPDVARVQTEIQDHMNAIRAMGLGETEDEAPPG